MDEVIKKKQELTESIEAILDDDVLIKQLINDPALGIIALSVYMDKLMTYTFNDLQLQILGDDVQFKSIAKFVLTNRLEKHCLGCLYDKCDQYSHMGANGCLESNFFP